MNFKEVIKAVIIDIDGCLTSKIFGQPLDLESLSQIQTLSKKYLNDPAYPMLILNTGRDLNHTELMAKILDAFYYFIVEMGAAVVSVRGAQLHYELHPSITTQALKQFDLLRDQFLQAFPQYKEYLQFGKRYMISFLFENQNEIKAKCVQDLRDFMNKNGLSFVVDEGHNFINIVFPGINKGSGIELLFKINPELNRNNVAGIGDSTGDWDFLKECAFSACPANGSSFLKEKCHYTAINQEAQGVLEILHYIVKRNKFLLEKKAETQKKPSHFVKAVITDINGTIDSAFYGKALDLGQIRKLRNFIDQSRNDKILPQIIFNTGWDLNYTLLYAQLLNAMNWHIIERGSALVMLRGPFTDIILDPRIDDSKILQIATFQDEFTKKYPNFYRFLQVGKKYTVSFQFEYGSFELEDCYAAVVKMMKEMNLELDVEKGGNFINISVSGINKGTGAELLLKNNEDLDFNTIVGIGDSEGDWQYIQKCGFKACPSNACKFLRDRCDYVASKPETEGVLEILERIIHWNLEKLNSI